MKSVAVEEIFKIRCDWLLIENPIEKYKKFVFPDDINKEILYRELFLFDPFIDDDRCNLSSFYHNKDGMLINERLTPFWVRTLFIKYCGFTLLTNKVLDNLVMYMESITNKKHGQIHVLEIGSGLGSLSFGMSSRNINVTSVDFFKRNEPFHDYKHMWIDDTINGYQDEVLKTYINDIDLIVCSWPDMASGIEKIPKVIKAYRPDLKIIYCGELYDGCTANDEFFDQVSIDEHIDPVNNVYKRWQGIHDAWYLMSVE